MRMTAEERFETARLTLEMIGLVERLLAEQATRQELQLWAELLVHARGGHVFKAAAASGLLSCLLNLDAQLGDEPLIRAVDLAAHVEDTRAGLPAFDSDVFVTLTPTAADVAARTGTKVTRFIIDGLGWMEGVHFASLATGRRFAVFRQLWYPLDPPRTSVITYAYPAAVESRAEVLADLFDTLLIDSD
jgi:hypothetical protein